jgi:integrase
MRGRDRIWRRLDRNRKWWFAWRDPTSGKRRKKQAERNSYEGAKKEQARLELGLVKVSEGTPITFAKYAKRWLESHVQPNLKPSTAESYEGILDVHLRPRFGKLALEKLARKDIKSYLDELASKGEQSRNTIKNIFAILRAMLSHAVEDDLLPSNPAIRLGRFNRRQDDGRKAEFLTPVEAEAFLQAARTLRPNRYPLFLTALRSGQRLGEMLAMEWEDIQFGESEEDTGRHILVRHNYTHGKFTSPKNRKERRVDLNKELRRVLIELRDQRILKAMQRSQEPEEISGLVFPSETGGPLDSRNVYHRDFLPCLKAAGLRRVTWHSLRHSFAAHLLIQNQASLTYVKEQMGHSSIQVTVDIYGHLVPGGNIKWIDRLGSPVSKEPEVEPRREEAKVEGAK